MAGEDSNDNDIFIGQATFNGVLTPGRFLIESIGSNPVGLYAELNGKEVYTATNDEYLFINSSCDYQWVKSENGSTVPFAIKVVGSKTYYIGRVFAQGTLNVGKILLKNRMYYSYNGLGYTARSYEVLVCYREFKIDIEALQCINILIFIFSYLLRQSQHVRVDINFLHSNLFLINFTQFFSTCNK